MEFHNILGVIGVSFIIYSFLMIQIEKLKPTDLIYSILNAVGALLIIISLYYRFNLSAFIIEFFWLLISLFGIYRFWKRKKTIDI